ncbi:MAG: GntR family transcriptional regulator [Anaerolineales bacterium]|jgi:GntR family transcriptional regulator|nr:GntR family transcriptional regulator [Anaerolineales bacterium]
MNDLTLKLDFRSGDPIYEQLVAQIKHMIATGTLSPGDQLPTVRQVAADLRVNFNTVARAYRILDEAGIISTQHGRGTYILDPPSPEATEKLRHEDLVRLTERYIRAVFELGFSPQEAQKIFAEKIGTWANGTPPALDEVS